MLQRLSITGITIKILFSIKCFQYGKYLLSEKSSVPEIKIEPGLGPVYDSVSNTFHIMNERNVSFLLSPPGCASSHPSLLLTVSSGPLNKKNRDRWREDVRGLKDLRLIFLVAAAPSSDAQKYLEAEHAEHADILQSSLQDGHRKLGYKILTSYVWAHNYCHKVKYIGKTDDNVVVDLPKLIRVLEERERPDDDFMTCSVPKRNMKTLRNSRKHDGGPHMTGNWSLSKEDLEADVMPDFCCGFLSLTTPKVGCAVLQVALTLYPDKEVVQSEDSLITGVLRERLPWVRMELTQRSWLWSSILSHCPFITITKQTFFNDLVLSKHSSRSNVQYVGSPTNPRVWRYYICLIFEVGIEKMRDLLPQEIVPDFLWNLCKR